MSHIEIRCVSKTFDNGVRALHEVSLSIRTGSFVAVIGPSGAGKSTLLRIVNGLERPTAGTVEIDGEEVTPRNLRRIRSQLGMVFQQFNLVGRLNVATNVLVGRLAQHKGIGRILTWFYLFSPADYEIVRRVLDRVGLTDRAWDRADRLSGGQQQRVGIARALAQQPKAILADEPVASLDPVTGREIMALLREICDSEGITTVVNLHQVDLAQQYADRVIGLNNGQIVYDGLPGGLSADVLTRIYGAGLQQSDTAPSGSGGEITVGSPAEREQRPRGSPAEAG